VQQSCLSVFFRLPSFPLVILTSLLFVPSFTFANETDQEMPVSAVGGTVHADLFTGTATVCGAQHPSLLGGRQGGPGSLFGIPYSPGGFVDGFMETYAGPHDYLNSFFHYNAQGYAYNYSGFAYGFGEALSALNVGVATPFAAASGVPSYADSVLLSR